MSINSRFELLIKVLFNGKQSAFACAIGVTPSVINNIVGKRQGKPSFELMEKISTIEEVNIDWLISGRGEMLMSKAATLTEAGHMLNSEETIALETSPNETSTQPRKHTAKPSPTLLLATEYKSSITKDTPGAIPLVSEKAAGGLINDENIGINERDVLGYYVIPKFRHLNVDFMIEVYGDSMIPSIYPGDIIACSVIYESRFIHWNKPHLIATREQGMIVKRLRKSTESNCLLAVSDNEEYDPFDIPKDEITGLARVVGVIHIE